MEKITSKYTYTNVNEIIAKIYRDLNASEDIEDRWHDIVEWISEALEYMNIYPTLRKKNAVLKVKEYKAKVPCDFYEVISVGNYRGEIPTSHLNFGENKEGKRVTDNYYFDYPYYHVNYKDGELLISYLALPVDECTGFPLIPNYIAVREALEWYIIRQMILGGYQHPAKIGYMDANTFWKEKLGQAIAHYRMPSLPEMEKLNRSWNRLIPNMSAYEDKFINNSKDYLTHEERATNHHV